uniref:Tr-type G domain-containing protein n=2 Tax=Palpitomonas bilix TaxID=652834 RepID=A0A7S3DHF6_9EUKA|mmetsp:Transcript_38004/g.98116  ORF Transcript_38004/g.98116 Transcript_38004/m.98116 type:complete len:472 (+) Transcript_38004:142-1557(+)
MRLRGAKATDLIVLVIAAEDGVRPQTLEVAKYASELNVPMIIALNKCDKPEANPDRVKGELLEHGIAVEGYGGTIQCVEMSALQNVGVDDLMERIHLEGSLLELKSDAAGEAEGVILESRMDKGLGPLSTVLIQAGTLKLGDFFVVGKDWGKVRVMRDTATKLLLKETAPGLPAEIAGLRSLPSAGEELICVPAERTAREVVAFRQQGDATARQAAAEKKKSMLAKLRSNRGESLAEDAANEETSERAEKELSIVIKTDVAGSLEAVVNAVSNINSPEVAVKIAHASVGNVCEGDVAMAIAAKAKIYAFNTRFQSNAVQNEAKARGIECAMHRVIYSLLDETMRDISERMEPERKMVTVAIADILTVFDVKGTKRLGGATKVAGCRVKEGTLRRDAVVRVVRNGEELCSGRLSSLKSGRDDVPEIQKGSECGVGVEGFDEYLPGDKVEVLEERVVKKILTQKGIQRVEEEM